MADFKRDPDGKFAGHAGFGAKPRHAGDPIHGKKAGGAAFSFGKKPKKGAKPKTSKKLADKKTKVRPGDGGDPVPLHQAVTAHYEAHANRKGVDLHQNPRGKN